MKRTLLLLFGILLLTGYVTHPQTQDKLYPDVKVSRLLARHRRRHLRL